MKLIFFKSFIIAFMFMNAILVYSQGDSTVDSIIDLINFDFLLFLRKIIAKSEFQNIKKWVCVISLTNNHPAMWHYQKLSKISRII